jgi:hypothetical protein
MAGTGVCTMDSPGSYGLINPLLPEIRNLNLCYTFHYYRPMQVLDLSYNRLQGTLPSQWFLLTNMKQVSLEFNRLGGNLPPQWVSWSRLQTFTANNNTLTGFLPPNWGNLAQLRQLVLSHNRLTGSIPAHWNRLARNLKSLVLTGNRNMTGTLPRQLCMAGQTEALLTLNVSGTGLTTAC